MSDLLDSKNRKWIQIGDRKFVNMDHVEDVEFVEDHWVLYFPSTEGIISIEVKEGTREFERVEEWLKNNSFR